MSLSSEFHPNWIVPPGATILDLIEEKLFDLESFASRMNWSRSELIRLVHGDIKIDRKIAETLENKLGSTAQFWLNREEIYRKQLDGYKSNSSLRDKNAWLKTFPIRDMQNFGWLDSNKDKFTSCLEFFDVTDPEGWNGKYSSETKAVAFRTSPTFGNNAEAVIAWLRQGQRLSTEINCSNFDTDKLYKSAHHVRRLTRLRDPKTFVPQIRKILAASGVAFVIARCPSGCRASGATRFVSPSKAMLIMSFRYLTDDHFWFTLFHEIGHLLLHGKEALFVEDGSEVTDDEEVEANSFAANLLIPGSVKDYFSNPPRNVKNIIREAVKLGVSPGIVVGQLQAQKMIGHNQYNKLKRRYTWREIPTDTAT